MHFAVQKDVFLILKYGKTRWRPGLHPGPRWGSLRRSPDPLVGWGGDTHPQTPTRSAPSALRFSRLRRSILEYSTPSTPRISRLRRSILAFPLLLIYEMTTGPAQECIQSFNLGGGVVNREPKGRRSSPEGQAAPSPPTRGSGERCKSRSKYAQLNGVFRVST